MRLLILLLLSFFAAAGSPLPPSFPTRHAFFSSEAVKIDGILDDSVWQHAESYPIPYEWAPGEGLNLTVETKVQIAFDDHHLYLAFRAFDPNTQLIRSTHSDRDRSFNDDTVGFMFDPFQDGKRAYQLRVNALGVQMDAVNSDVDESEDWSWDVIWDAATKVHEKGYDVEIAVPFKQIRYPDRDEAQSWNFFFMRDYPRTARIRYRDRPLDRSVSCFICLFQPVQGIKPAKSKMNLEITPTLTAKVDERRDSFPDGDFQSEEDSELGASVRWGINTSTTLNATLNPDFSQIEADTAQLDVNKRFALFFAEKRPFFLEGSDYFGTPIQAVFTRTLADPSYGLKLTGKLQEHTFGVLLARDEINNMLLPSNQGSEFVSLDQEVDNQMLRYRMDLKGGSTVGVLYTARESSDYHNKTYGVDAMWRISSKDTLRFQSMLSDSQYSEEVVESYGQKAGKITGNATVVRYNHSNDDKFQWVNLHTYSPDFRADTGFINRVDTRIIEFGANQTIRGNDKTWFRSLFGEISNYLVTDHEDQVTDWGSELAFHYTGPRQTLVKLEAGPMYERINGSDMRFYFVEASVESRPNASLYWIFSFETGESVDYANSRKGYANTLNPNITWHWGEHFEGNFDFIRQELRADGAKVFHANLLQTRFIYHFNRRAFVRSISQYTDIERNPANYTFEVEGKTQELFTQLLFSYKLNPQSAFLAGYTDGYRGNQEIDLTQAERSIFLKLSYAWLP